MKNSILYLVAFLLLGAGLTAQKISSQLENKVIQWRHEIHQNPELSNREFKTAEKIAAHLRSLGIDVQTGIAHTGVVGLLKGKRPGKTDTIAQGKRGASPFGHAQANIGGVSR